MEQKIATTISQSKKLAEILPPESADMFHFIHEVDTVGFGYKKDAAEFYSKTEFEYLPCWSLAALLQLMPYKIDIDDKQWYVCCIGRTENEYLIFYSNVNNGNMLCQFKSEEFVDAAVDAVCWLLENGYIEKK